MEGKGTVKRFRIIENIFVTSLKSVLKVAWFPESLQQSLEHSLYIMCVTIPLTMSLNKARKAVLQDLCKWQHPD